ncbi:glycosyltransferase family 4 protein [Guptibacillus hwajinpoensis]|uniref:Spore coat protein SA n=1 Tax=Guptibacillus hwajinpoensis TaxID=208199 RepID=A0ABU0K261_9BACL|nr:glycosyltransferase family 4 protein [Alkalihalobacillus hemicentroti]MDQ0483396.1 spore coat protein SA [Alkalihalobacillus hemicentroti]
MNIALIATEKLPVPAIRGGAIQIYLEAVTKLLAKHHQVTVISIEDKDLQQSETVDGVHFVRMNQENYVTEIKNFISSKKFDVIHVCNRPLWIETLKESSPSSKFILSIHNEMFALGKMTDEEGEKCVSLVSKIVTVSDYIGQTITSRFPSAKGKVQTVYSGVDLTSYHPRWTAKGKQLRQSIRSQLQLSNKKIVLFVGRLSKVKGPHILLHSLPEIIAQHPDAHLVFIGSKWFGENNVNNYVKHLYTLGAMYPDNITFIKFVEPKDIPKLYSMADVFVCCSQWQEPLARVHYEAMAAGLPVLTSDRGGNPEVINEGKNGHVIHQFEEPTAYAKAINSLLSSEGTRDRLGKNGRTHVEGQFGWSRVASNLKTVYETAARR